MKEKKYFIRSLISSSIYLPICWIYPFDWTTAAFLNLMMRMHKDKTHNALNAQLSDRRVQFRL